MGQTWSNLKPGRLLALIAAMMLGLGFFSVPSVQAQSTITVCASGCDYMTIQEAIDNAASGDVIDVAAGVYAEQLYVSKTLTLRGSNAGVEGNATRQPEAVITYPTPLPTDSWYYVLYVEANDVTIDGFEVQDQPQALSTLQPFLIYTSLVNNFTLRNNRILGGDLQLYVGTSGGQNAYRTGLMVERNYFDGGPFVNSVYHRAMYIQGTAGTIQDNVIVNANIGIQYMPYHHTTSGLIQRNTISAALVGLYHNYQNLGAAPVTWKDNDVRISPNDRLGDKLLVNTPWDTPVTWRGIHVITHGIQSTGNLPQVSFLNNRIDGALDPLETYNSTLRDAFRISNGKSGTVTLLDNSFENFTTGVNYVNDCSGSCAAIVNATCNWWGSNALATVTTAAGPATFLPYLTNGVNNSGAIGFQPVPNSCNWPVSVYSDLAKTNFVSGHTTIQAAINAAAAGDVIEVAAGTYAPTSQVLINKSITMIGAGSESTTIDVGGYNAWGVYITADNVTIQGFTIQGNAATNQQYGLKVGTGNNTGPSVHINEGLTLSDIKVQGTRRTGLDLNGVRNATLQGITATGATHGFGLSISSSHDVTITDLSTTGNAWGDVGIFPAQTVYQFPEIEDPSGIVFGGTINLSSGNGSISVQDGTLVSGGVWVGTISNDPTDNADVTVPTDFLRVVNSTRIADGLIMHNVGLEPAINSLALTLVSSGLFANTAIVNLNSGFWEVIQGLTIQAAINAAAEGDIIQVGPGIYLETLDLNRNNLTVRSSDGAETTTIRGGGGAGAADAVVRFSANGVTLQGFTIDRANAAANSRAIAPMASDGATISNNIIINSFRGIQGDFYGKPINLTISGNTFADTVQYGIAGTEDMANLTISGNTFRTTVEGIGLGVGVGLAGTPEQLFAGQIWQLSAGYAIKDYRVSGEPIIGAPYLAVPADLVIYQGAANSGQPAGVNLTATIPISLDTNGHAIGAATFSLASSSCFNVANPDTDVQLASGQSGVDLFATLNADDGALDIAIISASSLVNGLLVNVTVNYTTTNDCLNPGNGVTAVQFLTGNEAPTFGSVAGGSLTAGTSQNGSLRPRWGDCNGDGSIDAGDISACILEIFDRDGSSRTAALYSGFSGTIFCDSNQDLKIDAGDLVCTVRTINSLTCTAAVSAQSLSSVMVETSVVSDNAVQSSLVLNTNNSAAAAVFALEINPAYHFDATDSDGNGLPDALQLQIPADYQAAAVYDADTRLLQVIVASLSVPTVPLADGPLATLVLTSAGPVESAQPFTIQDISLGDVDGGSLPLEVVDLPTQMNSRLYLPSVIR